MLNIPQIYIVIKMLKDMLNVHFYFVVVVVYAPEAAFNATQ